MCLENPVTSSSVLCRVIWVIGIFPLPWHFPPPFPGSQQGRELWFDAQFPRLNCISRGALSLGKGARGSGSFILVPAAPWGHLPARGQSSDQGLHAEVTEGNGGCPGTGTCGIWGELCTLGTSPCHCHVPGDRAVTMQK